MKQILLHPLQSNVIISLTKDGMPRNPVLVKYIKTKDFGRNKKATSQSIIAFLKYISLVDDIYFIYFCFMIIFGILSHL